MDNLAERIIEESDRVTLESQRRQELEEQHDRAVHKFTQKPCEGGFASPNEIRSRYCETAGKFCPYRYYIDCQKYKGQEPEHKSRNP